jgi:hypothetical protein
MAIPKFEVLVTSSALKQGLTLLNTTEPDLQALFNRSRLKERLSAIAKAARLNLDDLDQDGITKYKRRQKAEELQQWSQLPSKGKSVPSFADDVHGNCWLYQPDLLKPSRYITALRLRSGTTGDRVTLHKAVAQPRVSCRQCDAQLETLAHVLGQCTHMKGLVIRRHNSIRDFISKTTAQKDGFVVTEEPSITTTEGTLKPDLVVVHQKRVHVVDVTVRHEDVGYLQHGYNEKHRKYTPLLQVLADQHQVDPGRVLPIVVGTRGGDAEEHNCGPRRTGHQGQKTFDYNRPLSPFRNLLLLLLLLIYLTFVLSRFFV